MIRVFSPDTTIGKISLINTDNVDQYLGEDIMHKLVDTGLPTASFYSRDSKQKLSVYFHPGNARKEFSEFKVTYANNNDTITEIVEETEVKTESGIKLGISSSDIKAIKGKPDSTVVNENIAHFYCKINYSEEPAFLVKCNMPMYYANFKFENDLLSEFSFGFE